MANILILRDGFGGLIAAEKLAVEIKGDQSDEIYYYEIATIIDQGDADTIYLHYGM